MQRTYWKGICHQDRMACIHQIETMVQAVGFIVDFKRFSDLSMSFIIELPGLQLPPLYQQLAHYLLMDAWTPAAPLSQNDGVLFLEVSFSQATGQLAIETPQVPG